MRRSVGSTVDVGVFGVSVGISVLFVLWGVFFTGSLSAVASTVLGFLIGSFGWIFVLSTFEFLLFVCYLTFSRHGKIKLGGDDDERRGVPEPERAAGRPSGAPAPQQMRAERDADGR